MTENPHGCDSEFCEYGHFRKIIKSQPSGYNVIVPKSCNYRYCIYSTYEFVLTCAPILSFKINFAGQWDCSIRRNTKSPESIALNSKMSPVRVWVLLCVCC